MNPHDVYKNLRAVSWTRVDMLLALFDSAIGHMEQVRESLDRQDDAMATQQSLRALKVVYGLKIGLDANHGELPQSLEKLYDTVIWGIMEKSREQIVCGTRILQSLREGFEGIRSEALELEKTGEVRPLDEDQALERTA